MTTDSGGGCGAKIAAGGPAPHTPPGGRIPHMPAGGCTPTIGRGPPAARQGSVAAQLIRGGMGSWPGKCSSNVPCFPAQQEQCIHIHVLLL